MSIADLEKYTYKIFKSCKLRSSSDFCVVAYSVHHLFFPKMAERIRPIMNIEVTNTKTTWESNTCYSHDLAKNKTIKELYDLMIGYRIVLDYFLNDDIIGRMYDMDEQDKIGRQIYKELDSKYIWCKKQMERKQYLEHRELNHVRI